MKQKNILTEKETKIVQLICMEYINQRIADELGLSKRTVEDYRERIKKKNKCQKHCRHCYVCYSIRNI